MHPHPNIPSLRTLSEELTSLTKMVKVASERIDVVRGHIMKSFSHDQIGVQSKETDGLTITVTIGEQMTWDAGLLEDIVARISPKYPEIPVSLTMSISKVHYSALPDEVKQLLEPAITRSLKKPSITIRRKPARKKKDIA
jgi:hypothetical protein